MRGWRVVLAGLCAGTLTACGAGGFSGLYEMPLPGGADVGDHPYRVTVQFADVLDLVPQAGVKVDDVPVGRVDRIDLGGDGWTAEATLLVNGDVVLPANATAAVRQSSLLGEKFVELRAPRTEPATGRLADHATIPLERSGRSAEVEEVFGALSLLLNGGGVAQFQQIAREVNNALAGNEAGIRQLLSNVDGFVSELDTHRGEITRALDSLNRLSATLAGQRDRIAGVLNDLGPGIDVLTRQRGELVGLLRSLDRLSAVAVDTITRSTDDLVADLRALAPILRNLADAGKNLPEAFELLLTFPFTDYAATTIRGDYLNIFVDLRPPGPVPVAESGPDAPVVPLRPMDRPVLGGGGR
ncbi:MCE family protein [Amycolatopsis anabasis]|uniref:MCE family protein n=1 Tax=Amycolatopsis anabasis TaxID=1840409 RepID=UPI00131ECBE7|nr:MCE family protein [Amycolatopsis anabasis]